MILTCSLKCIINNVKPPQNFEFPETKLPCSLFGLKSFHGFVSLAKLEDVTDSLSSVLFCIIALPFMAGSSKNFQKHQLQQEHTKRVK